MLQKGSTLIEKIKQIVIIFRAIIEAMQETQFLIQQLEALSYIGIFLTSVVSNVLIPVPEEVVLLLFGYISKIGIFSLGKLIPIVIFGVLIGDIIMYILARKGNRFVTFFYKSFFERVIHLHDDEWIRTHIYKIIFLSRFMIQFRFIGPFLAGYKKISFKKFLLYDFLAICIYVPAYILVGRFFHKKITLIVENVNTIKNIIVIFVICICIIAITKLLYITILNKGKKPSI